MFIREVTPTSLGMGMDKKRSEEPATDFREEMRNYARYGRHPNEPMLEVRDKDHETYIIIEANGSRESDVVIDGISNTSLNISLVYKGRKIRKKVALPFTERIKSHSVKVRNGVAVIKLLKEK